MVLYSPGTTGNSKLVLVRAPFHVGGSTVDTKQHKGRFPDRTSGLRIRCLLPDVGIAVLRGGDDTVGVRGPIDRRDELVVL